MKWIFRDRNNAHRSYLDKFNCGTLLINFINKKTQNCRKYLIREIIVYGRKNDNFSCNFFNIKKNLANHFIR